MCLKNIFRREREFLPNGRPTELTKIENMNGKISQLEAEHQNVLWPTLRLNVFGCYFKIFKCMEFDQSQETFTRFTRE